MIPVISWEVLKPIDTRLLYPDLGYKATHCSISLMSPRYCLGHYDKLQELLRRMRTEAGLRQADVARSLDRPQSFVSKYESGERRLDFIEMRAVCRAIGISMEEFVRRFEGEL